MTAWANVDLAVESMRRGACDFIQKPWENVRLISILRTQIELRRAVQQAEILEAENRLLRAEGRPELIAKAPSMQPVLELLGAHWTVGCQRAHYRRAWHGQRSRSADAACALLARGSLAGRREHRRAG